jgi:hypothetical protein
VFEYLRSGTPDGKGFKQAREAMMSRLAVLGKQVRAKSAGA